jgi:hypothetical protein
MLLLILSCVIPHNNVIRVTLTTHGFYDIFGLLSFSGRADENPCRG